MSEPFIAEIQIFGGNFAPRSWAFCEGQLLPIAQYQALFSLLGTTYGGDGRSTFALPDLRGRVPIHPGSGAGLPTYQLGQKGGVQDIRIDITESSIEHSHSVPGATPEGEALQTSATVSDWPGGVQSPVQLTNMQPYLALSFIIALQGLFPSRN